MNGNLHRCDKCGVYLKKAGVEPCPCCGGMMRLVLSPPCDCGNPRASFHGEHDGRREFMCDECWEKTVNGNL